MAEEKLAERIPNGRVRGSLSVADTQLKITAETIEQMYAEGSNRIRPEEIDMIEKHLTNSRKNLKRVATTLKLFKVIAPPRTPPNEKKVYREDENNGAPDPQGLPTSS